MRSPPMVRVEWLDSAQALPGWQWLKDVTTPGAVRCVSVGFLVRHTSEEIALAVSLGEAGTDNAQVSGVISIPACAAVRMQRLSASSWPAASASKRKRRSS